MCWARCPTPRCTRGRRYSLAALLAIAILATAAGMRGYAGFATWARTAPEEVLARARGAVSPAEPEDVQVGVVVSGRGKSGPAVGGVFHGARGRAGRCGR